MGAVGREGAGAWWRGPYFCMKPLINLVLVSPPLSLYGSLKSVHVILHAVVVRCVVRMGGSGFVSCFYYVHLCTEQCMSIAVDSVCGGYPAKKSYIRSY